MFKKIFCVLITFIILFSINILPVSAEEAAEATGASSVQNWTAQNWKNFFKPDLDPTTDIKKYEELAKDYFKSNGYIVKNSIIMASYYDIEPTDLRLYVTDGNFKFSEDIINNQAYVKMTVENRTYVKCLSISPNGDIDIIDDNSLTSRYVVYNSTSLNVQNYFYCANPYQSFLDYLKIGKADFNKIVPPEGFNKSAIKYSDYVDCPYTKYGIKPYEVETENYVSAGLFSDLNIYYDSYFDFGSSYDHLEVIDFYVEVDDDILEGYIDDNLSLYDYYTTPVSLPDLTDFFNTHFKSVHYENDLFSVLDFLNFAYRSKYSSINDFISLKRAQSTDKYYLKFTLKSEYTITHTGVGVEPGSSNLTNTGTIFAGYRVTHTCSHLDLDTGEIGSGNGGLGSDISQADDTMSRPPTKDELEDLGFKHGYPNTSGNYPYKITIYRNGVEYFQMFFNSMPSVVSTYYTNKCIDYGVNVHNKKIYMYFKEQNMSKEFDFTSKNNFDELVNDGGFYDQVVFTPLSKEWEEIINQLLCVDTSEFNNTYTLHLWTNYTGEFPDNMNGFYCKFNWDLENSGHFQKNNSDDDYEYTQDYSPDDSFTDNNGNIHGGAVEPPTQAPVYNGFNNEDFSFDENNLWNYADSFLVFCANAFKLLPNFIWQLIGCSMVIVILLRILGR